MIDPIIENRFKELPPSYQSFVASDFPSEIAEVFAPSLKLTSEQANTLENGLILYLLFFFTQVELVEYIVNNTGADPTETTGVISIICKHLPEFANNDIYEQVRLEVPDGATALSVEITETENAIRSMEGLRTMAGDVSVVTHTPPPRAPVHQSSQADLLTRTPAAPTPAHTPPPPSWDTEA